MDNLNIGEFLVTAAEEQDALNNMGGLPFNGTIFVEAAPPEPPNAVSSEVLEPLSAEPKVNLERASMFQPGIEKVRLVVFWNRF